MTLQGQDKVGPPLADIVAKLVTCLYAKDYMSFVNGYFNDCFHSAEMGNKDAGCSYL